MKGVVRLNMADNKEPVTASNENFPLKKPKLSKFSNEELSEVVKHLTQRKRIDKRKQRLSKSKQKEKLKHLKRLKNIKVVDSRSFKDKCVAAGSDDARHFLENQLNRNTRVSVSSLKKKI